MNVAALRPGALPAPVWHQDAKMVALVHRTAAKDCSPDEFNQFIAVARDLNLNPLRKQIYAFVFNKENAVKRNMVIVVAIDGMRAISARGGLYRPDNRAPRWTISEDAKDPLTNPLGIECCEVSIFTGHKLREANGAERIEWNEVVGVAYWTEFAPIKKPWGDDTAPARLDAKKDGWIKSGRHMIAKCAEAIAHRKANPEPLSMVYAEEETHRGQVIEGEYTDLTPSEMAAKGETDSRMERIGGPALFATFDAAGTLERVPHGQFADRMLAATAGLAPPAVAALVERNRAALQEFWAHHKNDALELRKILESRSGVTAQAPSPGDVLAKAAAPTNREPDKGAAAKPEDPAALKLKTVLLNDIKEIRGPDLAIWLRDAKGHIDRLPEGMRREVEAAYEKAAKS